MESTELNEKLVSTCQEAHEKFTKLGNEEFNEIRSKLEYVIVSYKADKNPVGLYEIGNQALELLKEFKKENPRKVSKKLIDDLEKVLQQD